MPPDIVRPVASTTVGCLITMAYRLNMTWTDFRLDEGVLRAVGEGRSFSTSIVRGMGLVVEYGRSASNPDHKNRVPSKVADQVRTIYRFFHYNLAILCQWLHWTQGAVQSRCYNTIGNKALLARCVHLVSFCSLYLHSSVNFGDFIQHRSTLRCQQKLGMQPQSSFEEKATP